MDENKQAQLKQLPGVDRILEYGTEGGHFDHIPKSVLIPAIRAAIDALRTQILKSEVSPESSSFSRIALVERVKQRCTPTWAAHCSPRR